MKYSGRFGEYLVLTRLLQRGIEAYSAIKVNQDDYDITAIASSMRVIRIQVKATNCTTEVQATRSRISPGVSTSWLSP